ncbi:MAG TPA: response regulator [Geobacteraceae bacterium]
MASKVQIGNLLVEAGIISVKTLERALQVQHGSGKRLGTLLRDMGIVTEEEVVAALARQCQLRTVRNFADQNFPKELLDLIPARLALEKLIFPLKRHQGMLAIATLDPFDRATFDDLAEMTGMRIYLALATRDDIVAAIRRHYLVGRWATSGRQSVLLIDPSMVVTKLLQHALEKEGYELFVAHDGVEGLKLAFSCRPDLILCDLMMPRMDSYTFMHALKAHPDMAGTPVILLSGKFSCEEEQHALEAGFANFIAKPAMPIRVIVAVKRALAGCGTEDRASLPSDPKKAPPRRRKIFRGHSNDC